MLLFSVVPLFFLLNIALGQEDVTTHAPLNIIEDDPSEAADIPMSFYIKVHSYLSKSSKYHNYTLEDTINHVKEVDSWKAPKELQKKFPYYLSGYDYDSQPVWIAEVGRYNVREQIEKGPEAARNLTQYLFQAVHRIFKSMHVKDTPDEEVRTAFFVGDCEGLDLNQSTHIPTVMYVLDLLKDHSDFLALMVGHVVALNVNYVASLAFESLRSTLGEVFDKIEVHGANKAKWKPVLQKLLPSKAIPTWYGGNKEYTPLHVFG